MLQPDGRAVFQWNYDWTERLADGVVHVIGVAAALIGAIILVFLSASSNRAPEIASVLVYAAGLLTMLAISAAYNLWPVCSAKWLLRRFDHSAIYLLIAATYTPFLVHVDTSAASITLLVGVWSISIVGVSVKLLLPGRFDRLSIVLYLLLGWSVVLAYGPVVAVLPSSTVYFLAAGGVLYSAGVVFHVWASLRFQNAIWHAFVLVAAFCHYGAVLDFVALARS